MSVKFLLILTAFCLATATASEGADMNDSIYGFTATSIDGLEVPLSQYKGKALLIVNTASRCGFTPQYTSLQSLYDTYKDRGFAVLAFPANNFMNQEPGTDAEIQTFCRTKYDVTFDLFSKISVKGDDIHPLYRYLTTRPGFEGAISWNFNKFLIDREGNIIARFGSRTDPLSDDVVSKLEPLLSAE